MKKSFIFVCFMYSLFVFNLENVFAGINADTLDTLDSTAFEGVKAKVKYVAKGGFGTYSTVQGALNSIADASETNRYIVKVMPGIYNHAIQMKPYVDVTGSGRDNTKITSSASSTVTGANSCVLSNIWVENLPVAGNSAAILNSNASMDIMNVKVTVDDATGFGQEVFGIMNTGSLSSTISNSIVTVKSEWGPIGIAASGGSEVSIRNSKIEVSPKTSEVVWSASILVHWDPGYSKIDVKDSEAKSSGGGNIYNVDIEGDGEIAIDNSRIESIASANTYTLHNIRDGGRTVTVTNSKIYATGTAIYDTYAIAVYGTTKVGGSLVSGPILGTPKIVNSWDADFNPIPNQ